MALRIIMYLFVSIYILSFSHATLLKCRVYLLGLRGLLNGWLANIVCVLR